MGSAKTVVQKWSFGMDAPFASDIIDCKREIREREAAIKYHQEMLECEKEKLASLEKANTERGSDDGDST